MSHATMSADTFGTGRYALYWHGPTETGPGPVSACEVAPSGGLAPEGAPMAVIETEQLTKYYGRHRGIVDVDLSVEAGEVYGFLGPNGAGKTTTIRLLLDLIRPTSGEARIFGRPPADL